MGVLWCFELFVIDCGLVVNSVGYDNDLLPVVFVIVFVFWLLWVWFTVCCGDRCLCDSCCGLFWVFWWVF